jgi:hypothetical protein
MSDATRIPEVLHFQTATPSMALLIRVAEGLDRWAEHERHAPPSN